MDIPVSSMTIAEKLAAMEQLWAALEIDPDNAPPEWHREVLTERQQRIDSGEATFATLDDVRKRLERKLP